MESNDCLYIIPAADKPIKLVFECSPIEDNGDMTFTIKRSATLAEIAEWFDMTVDELIHTKNLEFGIAAQMKRRKSNDKPYGRRFKTDYESLY